MWRDVMSTLLYIRLVFLPAEDRLGWYMISFCLDFFCGICNLRKPNAGFRLHKQKNSLNDCPLTSATFANYAESKLRSMRMQIWHIFSTKLDFRLCDRARCSRVFWYKIRRVVFAFWTMFLRSGQAKISGKFGLNEGKWRIRIFSHCGFLDWEGRASTFSRGATFEATKLCTKKVQIQI